MRDDDAEASEGRDAEGAEEMETGDHPAPVDRAPLAAPSETQADLSGVTMLLGILVAIVVAAALKVAGGVLIPFVLALFLVYLIGPLMALLARKGVPNFLTFPVILGILVGLVAFLEVLVAQTVADIGERSPFYASRFESLVQDVFHTFGVDSRALREVDWIGKVTGAATDMVSGVFGGVIGFVGNLVLIITYTIFLLLGRKSFAANLARAYPQERADEIRELLGQVNQQIQSYISTKIVVSAVTGGLMYLILVLFGVDFALFFGLLGFLLNFIPTVGSAIAAVAPILIALLQFENPLNALWVAVALISVQQIIGNGIEPKLLGAKLNLSPIIVLFALVFFGWLWGFWGMVLSVPLMATLKIVMSHSERLRPISVLMEN